MISSYIAPREAKRREQAYSGISLKRVLCCFSTFAEFITVIVTCKVTISWSPRRGFCGRWEVFGDLHYITLLETPTPAELQGMRKRGVWCWCPLGSCCFILANFLFSPLEQYCLMIKDHFKRHWSIVSEHPLTISMRSFTCLNGHYAIKGVHVRRPCDSPRFQFLK